ncbi:hypothetical protein QVD99_008591 [Batrachochytrium dendrobatidis]|nr:hypothetical protein QVD99_008591 [Batrachochytrium dendrobatidis]
MHRLADAGVLNSEFEDIRGFASSHLIQTMNSWLPMCHYCEEQHHALFDLLYFHLLIVFLIFHMPLPIHQSLFAICRVGTRKINLTQYPRQFTSTNILDHSVSVVSPSFAAVVPV